MPVMMRGEGADVMAGFGTRGGCCRGVTLPTPGVPTPGVTAAATLRRLLAIDFMEAFLPLALALLLEADLAAPGGLLLGGLETCPPRVLSGPVGGRLRLGCTITEGAGGRLLRLTLLPMLASRCNRCVES